MYLLNDLPAAQEALWEMFGEEGGELLPLAWAICLASVNF